MRGSLTVGTHVLLVVGNNEIGNWLLNAVRFTRPLAAVFQIDVEGETLELRPVAPERLAEALGMAAGRDLRSRLILAGSAVTAATETPPSPAAGVQERLMREEIARLVGQHYSVESETPGHALLARSRAVNHILHGFISLFTFGFWLLVWLGLGLSRRDSRVELTISNQGAVATRVLAGAAPRRPGQLPAWAVLLIVLALTNGSCLVLYLIASGD